MRTDVGGTVDMLSVEYVKYVDVAELKCEQKNPIRVSAACSKQRG